MGRCGCDEEPDLMWQYLGLVTINCVALAVALGLAVYARRQRGTRGAVAFAWLMLLTAGWSLLVGLRLLPGATPQLSVALYKAVFVPIAFVAVAYLAFALQYTGRDEWLSRSRLALMCVVPFITQVMVWTNDAHGLFITFGSFHRDGLLLLPDGRTMGGWFWVHTLYSYSLVLTGMGLTVMAGLRSFHLYRSQAIALVLGAFLPAAVTAYTTFSPSQVATYFSPLGFVAMGIIYSWAIFRYRLLDLAPVARATLVEMMSDGMLVLDARGHVVDLNPAMQEMAGLAPAQAVGWPASQALATWPSLVERLGDETGAQAEITREADDGLRYYDCAFHR